MIINHHQINKVDCASPEGFDGSFIKYSFKRLDKNTSSPSSAEYIQSDTIGLSIIIDQSFEDDFEDYLFNNRIEINIYRIKNNNHRTVGTLDIDNNAISGYTLELQKGSDAECQSACTPVKKSNNNCKRILKGTYTVRITNTSSQSWAINKSLRLLNVPGRTGILLHRGVNARIWSEGCILAMRNNPTNDADDAAPDERANNVNDSEDFCVEIVNYIQNKENEIKSRYNIKTVKKILIITEKK